VAIILNVSRRTATGALAVLLLPAQSPRLPFQLKTSDLPRVRITLRAASTKPFSPQEGIVISGGGKVTLTSGDSEKSGQVSPAAVRRLLELLQREGMEQWQDVYKSQSSHYAARVIRVELDDEVKKQTEVRREEFPQFTRAVAAIKNLGLQACPGTSADFFQRL
jgi:hypothetical protein